MVQSPKILLDDLRANFVKSDGVIDTVIMKFKDDDWKVRKAAVNAVVLLAKHGGYDRVLSDAATQPFVLLLEDIRGLLRTSNTSGAVMSRLWDARAEVRTTAIEAIVQLATHGKYDSLRVLRY